MLEEDILYFIELFSEKSEQVKLITILLSALVAVFVLLLNQFFVQRRNRQEYLLEKIEKLSQLSIEYTDFCSQILDDVRGQAASKHIDYPSVCDEDKRKIRANIRKMEMICGLYFKKAGFDPNDYFIWNMEVLDVLEKGKAHTESEAYLYFEDAKQHIVNSDAKLAVLCSNLVRQYGYKTYAQEIKEKFGKIFKKRK